MTYREFLERIVDRTNLTTNEQAAQAVWATLVTLTERLSANDSLNLASQLPRELAAPVLRTMLKDTFDLTEFYKRVSEREDTDFHDAVDHAGAVVATLSETVNTEEMSRLRDHLSDGYAELFETDGHEPDDGDGQPNPHDT